MAQGGHVCGAAWRAAGWLAVPARVRVRVRCGRGRPSRLPCLAPRHLTLPLHQALGNSRSCRQDLGCQAHLQQGPALLAAQRGPARLEGHDGLQAHGELAAVEHAHADLCWRVRTAR
jgi:hypothetical protein